MYLQNLQVRWRTQTARFSYTQMRPVWDCYLCRDVWPGVVHLGGGVRICGICGSAMGRVWDSLFLNLVGTLHQNTESIKIVSVQNRI